VAWVVPVGTVVVMTSPLCDLEPAALARHLAALDVEARADAFAELARLLGASEASRRWLAAFAASDATET
jgi:hypothetical protein